MQMIAGYALLMRIWSTSALILKTSKTSNGFRIVKELIFQDYRSFQIWVGFAYFFAASPPDGHREPFIYMKEGI